MKGLPHRKATPLGVHTTQGRQLRTVKVSAILHGSGDVEQSILYANNVNAKKTPVQREAQASYIAHLCFQILDSMHQDNAGSQLIEQVLQLNCQFWQNRLIIFLQLSQREQTIIGRKNIVTGNIKGTWEGL